MGNWGGFPGGLRGHKFIWDGHHQSGDRYQYCPDPVLSPSPEMADKRTTDTQKTAAIHRGDNHHISRAGASHDAQNPVPAKQLPPDHGDEGEPWSAHTDPVLSGVFFVLLYTAPVALVFIGCSIISCRFRKTGLMRNLISLTRGAGRMKLRVVNMRRYLAGYAVFLAASYRPSASHVYSSCFAVRDRLVMLLQLAFLASGGTALRS